MVWTDSNSQDLRVQIQIIQKDTELECELEWVGDGDAFVPRSDWVTYDEYVLGLGHLPRRCA